MAVIGADKKIHKAMTACEGVTAGVHRFGGTEFRLGNIEIGHIHGNFLVDIPLPFNIRNKVIEKGEAQPHHVLPNSGWVSVFLYNEFDVNKAIKLLKKSYQIAASRKKKISQPA